MIVPRYSLYINNINNQEVFYKLGFANELLASACSELLHKLCRHIRVTSAEIETSRQLRNDPTYQALFSQIDNMVRRQMARNPVQ